MGLRNFRDVGYPDSATLLRIGEFVHSGRLYPDFERPPYLVTLYGPLTYVLLGIPYRLAEATRVSRDVGVRLAVVSAFLSCALLTFSISRRVYGSVGIAWLSLAFAISPLPLAEWTTQVRGDFVALAFSLLSIHLLLRANRPWHLLGAAVAAGCAVLTKQTFLAAPLAVIVWLAWRRRWQESVLYGITFLLTVGVVLVGVLLREPLMWKHLAALRSPILELHGAVNFIATAGFQMQVPFAVLGGLLALQRRAAADKVLVVVFCVLSWLVAILTIPQVGGSINYFWEPLMASAILAGPGLWEAQRQAHRKPMLLSVLLLILLVRVSVPILKQDAAYLRECYLQLKGYESQRAKWNTLVSLVSGRRLLSSIPDLTVHSRSPEIPDPFLNAVLESRARWSSDRVVTDIAEGNYELIVFPRGWSTATARYRGIRSWSSPIWQAVKARYGLACIFDGMEIWLPRQGAADLFPSLSSMGCSGVVDRGDDPPTSTLYSRDP